MSMMQSIPLNPVPGVTNRPLLVVGGFDGHGSISAVVFSKANNVPPANVIVKYPDCSPEGAPKLLYSLSLFNTEVILLDIAINIKNPAEWFQLMRVVASNNRVTLYDHHETNLKFANQLREIGINLLQFGNTVDMNRAISNDDDELFRFSLVGSVTDRDGTVKKVLSEREISEYLYLANRYDVLIRQNLSSTVSQLLNTPKEQLMDVLRHMVSNIEYPPERLVSQVQLIKKYYNLHIVRLPDPKVMAQWLWKVMDQYAYQNGLDYIIAVGQVLDRQINQYVPVTFVVKYWLSDAPSPLPLLRNIIGNRRIIGHADGFSISATTEQDAEQLALQVAEALVSPSSVVEFLPAGPLTSAVAQDFRTILQRLTEILETQRKMYAEYLELKRQQVELLKGASSEDKRRYD